MSASIEGCNNSPSKCELAMEMKLSGTRIKALRIKLSWSQEKLAEEAGLNPRTVQRAEGEGSASLRTRLLLAAALQVQPEELDAESFVAQENKPATASVYYLAILLLVSLIYIAAQPAYFSFSVAHFSWINIQMGRPWHQVGAWWIANCTAWALLSLPLLSWLYRKQRPLFRPYVVAVGIGFGVSVLRLWEPTPVAEGMTAIVYLCGIALLLSLYAPRLHVPLLRHGVYMCLGVYLFLWLAHEAVFFVASAYADLELPDGRTIPRSRPLWWVVRGIGVSLVMNLRDLVQLIPIALVLALSSGERQRLRWPGLGPQAIPEPPVTP